MTRGAILFAHNSPKYDYYSMAVATAKRINHFLDLPVTIVTDEHSVVANTNYNFDNTVITVPDKNNKRDWGIWINKGRYQAFEFSPYDETILLDVDYIVNSNKLLKTFQLSNDICGHNTTNFLMLPTSTPETVGYGGINTFWATAVMFKKTQKAQQVFDCMKMIQNNYEHYANLNRFLKNPFRNDYAFTLALKIVNGHVIPTDNITPWNLVHIGNNVTAYKNKDSEFNTEYTLVHTGWKNGKIKKEQIIIKDLDFHLMDKDRFWDII